MSLRHVWAVFCSVGGAHLQPDARLNRQEVTRILSRMFQQVDQEVKVDQEAVEEICSLTFRMFDGCVHKGASVWLSSCCPLLPPASPLLPSAAPAGPLLVRCCPLLVLAGPLLPSVGSLLPSAAPYCSLLLLDGPLPPSTAPHCSSAALCCPLVAPLLPSAAPCWSSAALSCPLLLPTGSCGTLLPQGSHVLDLRFYQSRTEGAHRTDVQSEHLVVV